LREKDEITNKEQGMLNVEVRPWRPAFVIQYSLLFVRYSVALESQRRTGAVSPLRHSGVDETIEAVPRGNDWKRKPSGCGKVHKRVNVPSLPARRPTT
jgi:hypothetical protein